MTQAQPGNTVRVHYTGKLDDGTVFDSSKEREPLEFTLGTGEVIRGFEEAVAGMEPGQEQTVKIPAEQAYGSPREDLVFQVPKEQFPDEITPEVGQQLQVAQGEEVALVTVTEVNTTEVTLDANHPLAGKDLTFELELVEIAEKPNDQ
jgi:peptidylprolyl isomerase